jgi:hypothetical protein
VKAITTPIPSQHLPFGLYRVEIGQAGFEPLWHDFEIQSSISLREDIRLKISSLQQSVNVITEDTLLDTDQAGSVNQIGNGDIESRLGSTVNDADVISVEIVEAARDSLVIGQA